MFPARTLSATTMKTDSKIISVKGGPHGTTFYAPFYDAAKKLAYLEAKITGAESDRIKKSAVEHLRAWRPAGVQHHYVARWPVDIPRASHYLLPDGVLVMLGVAIEHAPDAGGTPAVEEILNLPNVRQLTQGERFGAYAWDIDFLASNAERRRRTICVGPDAAVDRLALAVEYWEATPVEHGLWRYLEPQAPTFRREALRTASSVDMIEWGEILMAANRESFFNLPWERWTSRHRGR